MFNMFELKISNLSTALQLSEVWATHVVSLLDPDINDHFLISFPKPTENQQIRRYHFHDITPTSALRKLLPEAKIATSEQMQDILDFTASLQSTDKLLVHCHAGISRSTAVACGILCQHGLSPKLAIKHVLSIRPQAFPNKHILTLFDEILGFKGQLVEDISQEFGLMMSSNPF
jgi:predicted protein tyrosine phosphatase